MTALSSPERAPAEAGSGAPPRRVGRAEPCGGHMELPCALTRCLCAQHRAPQRAGRPRTRALTNPSAGGHARLDSPTGREMRWGVWRRIMSCSRLSMPNVGEDPGSHEREGLESARERCAILSGQARARGEREIRLTATVCVWPDGLGSPGLSGHGTGRVAVARRPARNTYSQVAVHVLGVWRPR